MEVIVISREMIKPSTPTPHHLKRLKLSLIDQYIPSTFYVRIVLLYSAGGDVSRFQNTNTSERLKKSLSEVLTHFYPLAGTANNNQWIDCDDNGLEYIEARVKGPHSLDQLLSCPSAEELDRLVPRDAYAYKTGFKGLSAVQVTVCEGCGGMAIGFSLSHIITDASSLGVFIDTWARISRGGEITIPKFDLFPSLFPPRDIPASQMGEHDPTQEVKKLAVRRFVFPQSKINALKGRFKHQHPTKVEVVSALIFKCFIKVGKLSTPSQTLSPGIAMNLRGRMSPPLPMHYVGNMIFPLMIEQATPEMSLNNLGMQLRELIKVADGEYLKKLQADDASLLFKTLDEHYKQFGESRIFQLSSWCRFPFYEADFGWGGPTWVAPVYVHDQDCCVLVDAKNGDGVEAWLILEEEDMKQFESNNELLEFTCPDPM